MRYYHHHLSYHVVSLCCTMVSNLIICHHFIALAFSLAHWLFRSCLREPTTQLTRCSSAHLLLLNSLTCLLTASLQAYEAAPQLSGVVLLALASAGRGGEGDMGQRIRDEILAIQQRNGCKVSAAASAA